MSARATPLGSGLYFIDVLACLLFCLALALVGARFGREHTASVEVPSAPSEPPSAAGLTGWEVSVRDADGRVALELDGVPVSLDELAQRLRQTPPPSLLVHSDASALARVIAEAHAAGVHDIELAYEARGVRR